MNAIGAEHKVRRRRFSECYSSARARVHETDRTVDHRVATRVGASCCRRVDATRSSLGASVPKTSGMKTVARAFEPRTRAHTHTLTRATHARAHNHTHTSNAREPRGGHTHRCYRGTTDRRRCGGGTCCSWPSRDPSPHPNSSSPPPPPPPLPMWPCVVYVLFTRYYCLFIVIIVIIIIIVISCCPLSDHRKCDGTMCATKTNKGETQIFRGRPTGDDIVVCLGFPFVDAATRSHGSPMWRLVCIFYCYY